MEHSQLISSLPCTEKKLGMTCFASKNHKLEQESRKAALKDLQNLLETGLNSDFKIRV
jgi:hypothetical protein